MDIPDTIAPHDDDVLVAEARGGRTAALETIMRRHNRRLFRIARAILRDDAEAEDVVQEAYVAGFSDLAGYRGSGSFAGWLGQIAANLALSRRRRRERRDGLFERFEGGMTLSARADEMTPERAVALAEIRRLVERAVDRLPDGFREVFVLRTIEGMSVAETAALLDLKPETVKTRFHRARGLVRDSLDREVDAATLDAFPFAGRRCDRLVARVLARLAAG